MTRIATGTVLVLFSLYTAWVAWRFGYTSVFEVSLREHPSTQALIDLFIAGGLLFVIMVRDNQRSGRSFRQLLPYAILTCVFASVGPLLYFTVYPDLLTSAHAKLPGSEHPPASS